MRILFGYLFLFLSIILACVQAYSHFLFMDLGRSILIIVLTVGALYGSALSISINEASRNQKIAGSISLFASLGIVIFLATAIIAGSYGTSFWEYGVFIVYAYAFGKYGLSGVGALK